MKIIFLWIFFFLGMVVAQDITPSFEFSANTNNFLSLQVGAGTWIPSLHLDFEESCVVNRLPSAIIQDTYNADPNLAVHISAKYSVYRFFAFGISFDYNILYLEQLKLQTYTTLTAERTEFKGSLGTGHLLSIAPFVELRYPIDMKTYGLSPYVRVGGGINCNLFEKEMEVDEITFNLQAALGLEVFLQKGWSFFLETKWIYNQTDFTLAPNHSSKFHGDVDLSGIAVYVGVNFYIF